MDDFEGLRLQRIKMKVPFNQDLLKKFQNFRVKGSSHYINGNLLRNLDTNQVYLTNCRSTRVHLSHNFAPNPNTSLCQEYQLRQIRESLQYLCSPSRTYHASSICPSSTTSLIADSSLALFALPSSHHANQKSHLLSRRRLRPRPSMGQRLPNN